MNFGQRWLRRWCVQLFRAPTHPPVHSAIHASAVLPVTLAAALWFWREFIKLINDLHIYMAVVMENHNIYIYEAISVNYNFEERWKWAGLDSDLCLCANKLKTLPLGQTILHNHTQRHVKGSIWLFCGVKVYISAIANTSVNHQTSRTRLLFSFLLKKVASDATISKALRVTYLQEVDTSIPGLLLILFQ